MLACMCAYYMYDIVLLWIMVCTVQLTTMGKEHARAVLTQHQKFHKAQQVTTQLAALASEVGMDEFEGRLAQMRLMRDEWAKGGKVTLTTSTVGTRKHFQYYRLVLTLNYSLIINASDSTELPIVLSGEHGGSKSGGTQDTSEDASSNRISKEPVPETRLPGRNHARVCLLLLIVLISVESVQLSKILLPPKMRKRGRPKGADKTVIGLPKKKCRGNYPQPFLKMSPKDREKGTCINTESF